MLRMFLWSLMLSDYDMDLKAKKNKTNKNNPGRITTNIYSGVCLMGSQDFSFLVTETICVVSVRNAIF